MFAFVNSPFLCNKYAGSTCIYTEIEDRARYLQYALMPILHKIEIETYDNGRTINVWLLNRRKATTKTVCRKSKKKTTKIKLNSTRTCRTIYVSIRGLYVLVVCNVRGSYIVFLLCFLWFISFNGEHKQNAGKTILKGFKPKFHNLSF